MSKICINVTSFYTGMPLYNIKRNKYKTVCAEWPFASQVVINGMKPPLFLYIYKLYFNASKLYQKWVKLSKKSLKIPKG